jgi:hypothetical protein
MKNAARTLILFAAGLGIVSCSASTSLKNSWRDPTVEGPLDFHKVLVVMVTKDGRTRRTVEDAIVKRIVARRHVEAVPSYTVLLESDLTNKEHAKQLVEEAGFDGAVALRIVGVDKEVNYVPGTYPSPYYNFWGYYDYAWPAVYDPGYLQTDTIVNVETMVYSVKDAKLVWAGTTETFNPSNIDDMVDGIAAAVSQELTKQGLVK